MFDCLGLRSPERADRKPSGRLGLIFVAGRIEHGLDHEHERDNGNGLRRHAVGQCAGGGSMPAGDLHDDGVVESDQPFCHSVVRRLLMPVIGRQTQSSLNDVLKNVATASVAASVATGS